MKLLDEHIAPTLLNEVRFSLGTRVIIRAFKFKNIDLKMAARPDFL